MAPLQGLHLSGGLEALSACSASQSAGAAAVELHCIVARKFKPLCVASRIDNFREGYEMFCVIPTANFK
jgi:hypothetical protein